MGQEKEKELFCTVFMDHQLLLFEHCFHIAFFPENSINNKFILLK